MAIDKFTNECDIFFQDYQDALYPKYTFIGRYARMTTWLKQYSLDLYSITKTLYDSYLYFVLVFLQ